MKIDGYAGQARVDSEDMVTAQLASNLDLGAELDHLSGGHAEERGGALGVALKEGEDGFPPHPHARDPIAGNDGLAADVVGDVGEVDTRQFALRAGYYGDSKAMGKRSYFTLGVGINYNIFGLNFSYLLPSGNGVNRNPLSNTIRFSLLFNLGGNEENGSTNMSY